MAQGYLAQVQALIAERMKENPEEMKRKLKEIEEAKKKAKEAPKSPPKPIFDPQLTQEFIEELDKDSDEFNIQKVKDLIKRGADINAKNKSGFTPLFLTVILDNVALAKLLISAGADVNAKNKFGITPLKYAVRRGHKEIEALLKQHGAIE